ncbi:amino acid adenylation domain-containing protein [Luteimonas sp. RD2P54]|uniref:Amino acid adenylation domain-containing protein n=1 Tax=Luteimonas endophytica TaxID=3042023 RepID=A0ABT6J9V2_9GAMM|nr:amino acid adenylation domain-containing protein [Luteimonas endophytica]MDH5823602.1 amino acid adenylation domain-containing protein [Luteimonas endophytica]
MAEDAKRDAPADETSPRGRNAAHRVPAEGNPGAQAYDRTDTIWELVEQRAQAYPQRTAIVDGPAQIDYTRLTARANAIAGELAARGVRPGALVGVCLGRSWELAATLLGVLRAGCAYVPLDPEYPRERVRYMLEHARAAAVVVDGAKAAELCAGAAELVRLDAVGERLPDAAARPSAGDLAYVIYTSGSTGRPKGVAVEHRSVVAMTRSMRELLGDEELAGVLAAASICFDTSVMEILGTLSLGGTVVLAAHALALPELPAADRVRTTIMVPSSMQALLAAGGLPEGVRCVVLGGDVLKRPLVEQLHALPQRPRVLNVYGPTENTVYCTATEVPAGVRTITIGKPVGRARAYILDEAMQPVAAGVAGELHLGGDQLARGYLHDEARTKERFVAADARGPASGPTSPPQDSAPNGPAAGERLYRTGDRCRWTEAGEIEFLGRIDQQVKLRGFRVELEEIESALESMPGVDGAAAALVDADGKPLLVGYVVGRDAAATNEASRAYLAERLPKYMVPQLVMRLAELPRLPNGKLDRKRLPRPEPGCGPDASGPPGAHADPVAAGDAVGLAHRLAGLPKDERHAALLSVVRREIARFLRLGDPERVPPRQALEALGLDSLDSVELSHRLSTVLGLKLPASTLVEHPTPAAVAEHLFEVLGSGPTDRSRAPASAGAADPLGRFQAQLQSGHPPFLAARAPAWSATDKGMLIRELKGLLARSGHEPYSKLVRTGSGHRGTVADVHTGEAQEAIIWSTNLYLGLNRDGDVIAQARSALERFGTGMGTSPTASGMTDLHLDFEKEFAELVGKPAGCLFSTGFTANLGVIAGLLGDKDAVVMDQLCHASIVDGARLSGATIRTFKHNDAADLQAVLEAEASPYRTTLVVLEGVYSMGEGTAPVREIVQVAKRHGALVLVDEAHSFGFYGPRGAGICAAQGVTEQVDFIMTTLSKALGSLGGAIAASEEHVALLKTSARAYVFQATITPADIAAALAALRRLRTDEALRERLWDTTGYMRQRFSEAGYDLGTGDGPIVTPHFSDSDTLYAIARGLHARGIHTTPVTYPIVERGRGRLRFICSASHTRDDVDRTLQALSEVEIEVEREAGPSRRARLGRAAGASGSQANRPDGPADGPGAQDGPTGMGAAATPGPHPRRAGLEAWAGAFGDSLRAAPASLAGPLPSLAVSIGLPDGEAPVTMRIDGRNVAPAQANPRTPACSLLLADDRAISALCASDAQGLLESVIQGGCVLSGQVEPFVWLIGRLAERHGGHADPR